MKYALLFYFSLIISGVEAQSLSGSVIDEKAFPLSYVTVSNIRTQVGSYTDDAGKFNIDGKDLTPADEVVFTHIGYEDLKITVAALQTLQVPIAMKSKDYRLHEVVVQPQDARALIQDALAHIKDNYPAEFTKNHILFKDYSSRNGQRSHYYNFDFNMYLPSYLAKDSPRIYTTDIHHEMYKRKGMLFSVELKPTDLLKIMYPEKIFSEERLAENDFKLVATSATIDGEECDVIQFRRTPQKREKSVRMMGNAYINKKDKGIRFIEFHVYNEKPERFVLVAKMDTLNVNVKVAFKKIGEKYMLDYISQTTYASGNIFGKHENLVFSSTAKVLDRQTGLKMNEIVMRTEVNDIFTNEPPKDIEELKETPDMK